MARHLASVQTVETLRAIPGADRIEVARVNGWDCVVRKGEFAAGQRAVFFEIDSVPPDTERFAFLWNTPTHPDQPRPRRFRIRSRTMLGQLSQGLLMALDVFDELDDDLVEGTDLTAALGVNKWEPPLPLGMGEARAAFPSGIPKTDEPRVQSHPGVLEEIARSEYVITEKCDGTSATLLISPEDNELHVCGRNWDIAAGDNLYWGVAEHLDVEARLRAAGGRWCLQGEVCGPGVQGNPMGLARTSLFVFSVWDLAEHRYLDHPDMAEVCNDMGLSTVAVLEEGDSFEYTLDTLLARADGCYSGTTRAREGIVVRPRRNRHSPTLRGRLSFKAISNRYLLAGRD